MNELKLIFEKSTPGKQAWQLPTSTVPKYSLSEQVGTQIRTSKLNFPELSEVDIVRHYTNLSSRNYGIDSGFYPLDLVP